MVAVIELEYSGLELLPKIAEDDAGYKKLCEIFPHAPSYDRRLEKYAWARESIIDIDSDGVWLSENGIAFTIKKFKGTLPLQTVLPDGKQYQVYVQVPHIGLLTINEVQLEENCCTDRLQGLLDEGWRILCVCPPNAQRRPDYVLGRTKDESR